MNAFEELYNSTLKIVPIKKNYIEEEEELLNEERVENGMQNEEVTGGFIDMNIPVPSQVKHSHTDYNKIDPIAIYRNKVSLKHEPYDVDKVNVLYNRKQPGSQSFTSWINNSQKKASIEGKYYKNFVRWMDNNLRKSLWKEKCATGIQRVSIPELNGIKLDNVYKLYDFDYNIIWNYAVYANGKYTVIVNARRQTGDDIPVDITKKISNYNRQLVNESYFHQYPEAEFYGSKDIEDVFLHPNEYEVVDRENVSYANCQPATMSKLFQENDPRLPQLKSGSRAAYENYVSSMQVSQDPNQPEEKKSVEEESMD